MIPNAVCEEHDEKLGSATALDSHKLKQAEAVRKLSKALGGKLLHFYVYGAVEGSKLVIYLTHPAMLQEFNTRKKEILEEMRIIYKREGMKKELLNFTDIMVKVKPRPAPKEEVINHERDRSTGAFEVHGDGAIANKFKRIAQTIREKNARYEAQQKGGS